MHTAAMGAQRTQINILLFDACEQEILKFEWIAFQMH